MKNFHKKIRIKGETTPPPHLNLTMSSLGTESHHQPQNTQKQRKQKHTQYTQNKTDTHKNTKPAHKYNLARSPKNTISPNQPQDLVYTQN